MHRIKNLNLTAIIVYIAMLAFFIMEVIFVIQQVKSW
jgi:hypothetical protein